MKICLDVVYSQCVTYINASKKVEPQSIYEKLVHSPIKIKIIDANQKIYITLDVSSIS